jgi:tRNA threonylcarbamoyladenosine biosynthesis protein TsaB
MKLLCVDTATRTESIALVEGDTVLVERAIYRAKGHGRGILDDIDGLLTDAGWTLADVDGFVCGLGPGSFTGLRIALATLKGLALATGRPIYGETTTRLLCAAVQGSRAVAVIDARRDQVYVQGPSFTKPVCCDPESVAARLPPGPPPVLVGDGALKHQDVLRATIPGASIPDSASLHLPRAALLATLIDRTHPAPLATLEPVYVRLSDAEINYPRGFPDVAHRYPEAP